MSIAQEVLPDAPMSEETYRKLKAWLQYSQAINQEQLPAFTAARRILEEQGRKGEAGVLNVLEFMNLSNYELACLLEDMADHDPGIRGKLYARLLIVNVYETSLQLKKLLARDFRAAFRSAGVDESEIDQLGAVHRGFVNLFDECHSVYEDVRHGLGAHRDPSAQRQLDLIDKISIHDVTNLVIKMMWWTADLSRLLSVYTTAVANQVQSTASNNQPLE